MSCDELLCKVRGLLDSRDVCLPCWTTRRPTALLAGCVPLTPHGLAWRVVRESGGWPVGQHADPELVSQMLTQVLLVLLVSANQLAGSAVARSR
jgi:hypothetical protein